MGMLAELWHRTREIVREAMERMNPPTEVVETAQEALARARDAHHIIWFLGYDSRKDTHITFEIRHDIKNRISRYEITRGRNKQKQLTFTEASRYLMPYEQMTPAVQHVQKPLERVAEIVGGPELVTESQTAAEPLTVVQEPIYLYHAASLINEASIREHGMWDSPGDYGVGVYFTVGEHGMYAGTGRFVVKVRSPLRKPLLIHNREEDAAWRSLFVKTREQVYADMNSIQSEAEWREYIRKLPGLRRDNHDATDITRALLTLHYQSLGYDGVDIQYNPDHPSAKRWQVVFDPKTIQIEAFEQC